MQIMEMRVNEVKIIIFGNFSQRLAGVTHVQCIVLSRYRNGFNGRFLVCVAPKCKTRHTWRPRI